ncbi:MAG: hypothetical protein U0Y82_06195 [Thermoleophilia bacterium]
MSTTLEDNITHNTPIPALFSGSMSVKMTEPTGDVNPTNAEVDSALPFDVQVSWTQSGFIAGILGTISSQWVVELVYDRIGGPEGDAPAAPNPRLISASDGTLTNSTTFTVPAGSLPAGVYSMVVLLSLKDSYGLRLAAFEEIRPFRVY